MSMSISIIKQYPNLLEPMIQPDSGTGHFDFKFPTPISEEPPLQNDIVFCSKVMIRENEPGPVTEKIKNPILAKSESSRKPNPSQNQRSGSLRQPATEDSRLLRKSSSSRRHFNGLFGAVKFPVQMELHDMRKRQERREKAPLPEIPAGVDGELVASGARKSCWQLIRPLKRKGHFSSIFAAAAFGWVPPLV